MKLIDALGLKFPTVISLVGAGGKTSFIFTLAREAADRGRSVLITTTTAMFNPAYKPPDSGPAGPLFTGPPERLVQWLAERPLLPGTVALAARGTRSGGRKLAGYTPEELAPLLRPPAFDLVLIEADGAKMRPVKAPADHEPVIPAQTHLVAGCIGLDCLGSPLSEPHVHRPEHLAELTGQEPDTPVTPATLAGLAASEKGLFKSAGKHMKKVLVLNKADTPALVKKGKTAALQIMASGPADICLVTSFLNPGDTVRQRILPDDS
ncbi:MAG: putative selenium-dependent hydroxylase accessory protein YqeC [Desulfobacter sp.]|nr:MAG: putative selenium-dependent hydroxylase accessory protein YqeC [Desulfobacter sp.]